jgi:hypothetical protein
MNEDKSKNDATTEHKPSDTLEEAKKQALIHFLEDVRNFMEHDRGMNGLFQRVLTVAVEVVEKDPRAAFSGTADINAIVSALNAKSEGDISGSDIVGASPIGDVIDLIKELIDVLGKEKEFFLQIIKLIFCGC